MRSRVAADSFVPASYLRDQLLLASRSSENLVDGCVGGFSRTSSLADLAYVAVPGLTQRVVHNRSVVSLANLSDNFSEIPAHESPVVLTGGSSRPLAGAAAVAMLSTLMCGYSLGSMNTLSKPLRAALGIPPAALTPEGVAIPLPSNDLLWSLIVSIFMLGALLGCNATTALTDRWGRKTYLLWVTAVFFVGALLEAASALPECAVAGGWLVCFDRVLLLLLGRLVSGIACGGAAVVVPLYLGEVSPAHLRGALGTANQLALGLGMLAAQLLGLPAGLGTLQGWPVLLGLPALPALLQLLFQPLLLESPRWYVVMGNDIMAEEMLVQLRDRPPDDLEVQEELYCMLEAARRGHDLLQIQLERSLTRASSHSSCGSNLGAQSQAMGAAGCGSALPAAHMSLDDVAQLRAPPIWQAVATQPAVRRALLITVSLTALQQLSGVANLFNFSSTYLLARGFSDATCASVAVAVHASNVCATLLTALLMDYLGRRRLLLASTFGAAACAALLTLAAASPLEPWAPPLCIAAAAGFVGSFALGLGPVALLLPAEVFPAAYRSTGAALASSVHWTAQFATTFVFLLQAERLGAAAFVPHAALLLFGLVFAAVHVPETRGKSLDQIEKELSRS